MVTAHWYKMSFSYWYNNSFVIDITHLFPMGITCISYGYNKSFAIGITSFSIGIKRLVISKTCLSYGYNKSLVIGITCLFPIGIRQAFSVKT